MQYLERMDQVHKVYAEFCKSVQKKHEHNRDWKASISSALHDQFYIS